MKKLLAIIFALFIAMPMYAKEKSSPNVVLVGIELMRVSEIELAKSTYVMDVHLSFKCKGVCPKFSIELENGYILSKESESENPSLKVYRIRAHLHENFYAVNYPFETYFLKFIFKDRMLDQRKLVFVADPHQTTVNPLFILQGWKSNLHPSSKVETVYNPLINKHFSVYLFSIDLSRPVLMGLLKFMFPAIIIIFFAFVSFFIKPKKSFERFGIVSGALLGSVLFHLNMTASLPPLGYLTYIDMVMIINYVTLLAILFEDVYLMRLVDNGEPDKLEVARKIDSWCIFTIIFGWLIVQIVNAIYFFH
jgi:hypothetical protein